MENPLNTEADDVTYSKTVLGNHQQNHPNEHKVLGVRWDVQTDHLVIDTVVMDVMPVPTKRSVVSIVSRSFL
jgi:hypothetical protein